MPPHLAFAEMVTELASEPSRHLGRINVSKHRTYRIENEVRPVHSTTYRAAPTSKKFAVAKINRMLAENVMEPAATK